MQYTLAIRDYTWRNNQDNPIFATIDRVFSATSWDSHFPLTTLCALPRVGSDHAPILLDSGMSSSNPTKPFIFEKWWLDQPDFRPLVEKIWATPSPCTTAIGT